MSKPRQNLFVWNACYRGVFLKLWGVRLNLVWVCQPFRRQGW